MPVSLPSLPRPALFGLYGLAAGLIAALTFGELTWLLFTPSVPPEQYTAPVVIVPRLAVTVSPKVSVYPGGRNTVSVRIARERADVPVTVTFTSPHPGLSGSEITIPADQTSGQLEISAASNVPTGVYALTVTATATVKDRPISATATVEVTVTPIPPQPRLGVGVSQRVAVYQHGKNTFAVRVIRNGFDDDVTVSFTGLPEGVTVPSVTIPEGKAEAMVELFAEGGVKTGTQELKATAKAAPKGIEVTGETTGRVEVLSSPKLPVDIVFALDCTGSMRKAVDGLSNGIPRFTGELVKAQFDTRLGLVGFKDTTLGQPLKILLINDQKMTTDFLRFRTAVGELGLGGGGGEGESSLDGIAAAADFAAREGAVRVVVLITDGAPKKVDGRMGSVEETAKHLKTRKVDQLHIVAVPDHKKAFEPLWEGAKGKYFDLKAANAAEDYDKLVSDVAKAIAEAAPELPMGKPPASPAAPVPTIPKVEVKPPALPAGAEPEEPKLESLAVSTDTPEPESASALWRVLAVVAWTFAIVALVCAAMFVGQLTFLPGPLPSVIEGAIGYGGGLVIGLVAGTLACVALSIVDGEAGSLRSPLARFGGAAAFGLCLGFVVPLPERFFRKAEELPPEPLSLEPLVLDPPQPKSSPQVKPLELDDAPLPAAASKPKITAPKPSDGCPGCGRTIPGTAGERYCMLCDKTF